MYLLLGEPRSERTMMKIWKNEVLTSKVVYKVGSIVGTKFNSILGAAQHANPKNLAVLMKYISAALLQVLFKYVVTHLKVVLLPLMIVIILIE